jgi:CHAT domain-containing protein
MKRVLKISQVLLLCTCFIAVVVQSAEPQKVADADTVSVPKGIQDIVKLLDGATTNAKARDADIQRLQTEPAANASDEEKYIHYYLQSEAADRLGRVDTKVAVLKKALEFAQPGTYQEFTVLADLAGAEIQSGHSKQAIERRLSLLAKLPPSEIAGYYISTNGSLVNDYARSGDFEAAEKHLRTVGSALTVAKKFRNYSIYGFNWNMGYYRAAGDLAFQKGKFEDAHLAYRQAIDFMEGGMVADEARYNEQAKAGVPGVGSGSNSGTPSQRKGNLEALYVRISSTSLKLRKLNEAEFYAREGLKKTILRTGKSSIPTATSLHQLATVMLARDRSKDAIYLLNQSLQALKDAGVNDASINLAQTKKTLASALIAGARYADAIKIYADLDQTAKQYPDTARFVDVNSLDRVLALVRVNQLADAEQRARDVFTVTETRTGKKSKETTQAKLMLGMALAEAKKDDEAKALFQTGMAELIEQEREVAADADNASSKEKAYLAGFIESYLGLLERQYEKTPSLAVANEAFQLGDMARSSGVQKALNANTARANITNPKLAEMVRHEQDLNQQVTYLTRLSKELAMQPAGDQLPQIQAKIKADVNELRAEAKRVMHTIELGFPEYANLISPKPVGLAKIQQNLTANEVLITWFIGQNKSYVWAVPHEGAPQFKSVSINRAELKKTIATVRKSLDPQVSSIEEIPVFNFALSNQLYNGLFKPVEAALRNKNTLVVVPHDDIGQLPLSVLTTEAFVLKDKADVRFANYRDAPWLIKKFAIVSSPSATAFSALRGLPKPKEGRLDFIGFGDPLFSVEQAKLDDNALAKKAQAVSGTQLASRGVPLNLRSSPKTADVSSAEVSILPRLPDTNEEILEISKVFKIEPSRDLYLQKRANLEEVLKADLSNRKVVIFSTHGLVPGELDGLTQPALALTNPEVMGKGGDGLLKVDHILTLKLNADWVVLSACNTAAGEGEGAEALSGLGRAFFYAGARSLLVSSWPVDSQASRKLMTDLFKRQNNDRSVSKSQALQQASLDLLNQGRPDERDARYSYAHPLFWAPFVVVGD